MVLSIIERLCRDRQTLLNLYANYDCDEFTSDIFERLVNNLTRWACLT